MGIYGALATAVSGLRAQSTALANISGNIANSQTTGYKRMETSFVDLIPDAPVGRQVPGSVLANTRSTNNLRGDILPSGTATHIAQNGSGFFVVSQKSGVSDNATTFSPGAYYTRRGDFEMDREGYLMNGAGYYLQGVPVRDGNVAGSLPETIRIDNGLLPAKATTSIDYQLNLPAEPVSELLTVPATDPAFLEQTIEGGAITAYAANGASANMQLRWGKTADGDPAAVPATADSWQLFYLSDADAGTWVEVPDGVATFAEDGTLASFGDPAAAPAPNEPVRMDLGDVTIDGVNVGTVTLDFGIGGLTQFNDPNGRAAAALEQNGYPAGVFQSVAINDSGRVVASYSNGEQIELFQVVTANFNAENLLKRLDGGVYSATAQSGDAIIGLNGSITGGALESSNTDIADEFTKLITTQQAYAAGTRIVSTSDEMLQEALNMVR